MAMRDRVRGASCEGEALAIYNKVKTTGNWVEFCRQFMYDEDSRVARNALWILTKAGKAEVMQLQPLRDTLIDLTMTTESSSVCRLALNLVERLKMREDDVRVDFLDFCLEHMADIRECPGIQSLCMKLAYRMCAFFPELEGELKRTVEAMDIAYYSPAVKSVRTKILSGKMLVCRKKR